MPLAHSLSHRPTCLPSSPMPAWCPIHSTYTPATTSVPAPIGTQELALSPHAWCSNNHPCTPASAMQPKFPGTRSLMKCMSMIIDHKQPALPSSGAPYSREYSKESFTSTHAEYRMHSCLLFAQLVACMVFLNDGKTWHKQSLSITTQGTLPRVGARCTHLVARMHTVCALAWMCCRRACMNAYRHLHNAMVQVGRSQ